MHRPAIRALGVIAGLSLILTACGAGAASPAPATPPPAASEPVPSEAAASPSATPRVGPPEGQASSFVIGETSIGIGSVAFKAAIDELRAQGYTIDTPVIDASELIPEGVASGDFAFGSAANSSALVAMGAGAAIKFVVDRNANEWTIVSVTSVTDCPGLVASRVAIHSQGSVSGAMIRDWVKTNCPDQLAAYEPLIIAGSQNRAAALMSDVIDAAPAELRDWIVLDQTGEGRFHALVNFGDDLPDLHPTSLYANEDFIAANPDVTRDLIREIVLQNRRINTEDGYLLSLYERYLPEEVAQDPAMAKLVSDLYVERGLFDSNGGLTPEGVQYTVDFFGPDGTGDVTADLALDDVADLSHLEAVLDEIGRE